MVLYYLSAHRASDISAVSQFPNLGLATEISLPLITREFMYVFSLKPGASSGGLPGAGPLEEEGSAD
jgi:hypothetical protein